MPEPTKIFQFFKFTALLISTISALPEALGEVSAVATGGLVYVAGGNNAAGATNTLRSFDPAAHAWTTLAPYPGAARSHAGLAAVNGSVYLVGGLTQAGEPVATLQRYDPAQDAWVTLAPMPRCPA